MEYKVTLKSIQINDRMSDETTAFTATLYINGSLVGVAHNRGNGGPTDYHANGNTGGALVRNAEKYFESLPHEKMPFELTTGQPVFLPRSLESEIDKLVDEAVQAKEFKKIQRKFANHVIYGNKRMYYQVRLNPSIAELVSNEKGRDFLKGVLAKHRASKEWKEGFEFLNDNIPNELKP